MSNLYYTLFSHYAVQYKDSYSFRISNQCGVLRVSSTFGLGLMVENDSGLRFGTYLTVDRCRADL